MRRVFLPPLSSFSALPAQPRLIPSSCPHHRHRMRRSRSPRENTPISFVPVLCGRPQGSQPTSEALGLPASARRPPGDQGSAARGGLSRAGAGEDEDRPRPRAVVAVARHRGLRPDHHQEEPDRELAGRDRRAQPPAPADALLLLVLHRRNAADERTGIRCLNRRASVQHVIDLGMLRNNPNLAF